MKRSFLIIIVLIGSTFFSCKTCSTCSWEESNGKTYTAPEKCGSKADIKEYEEEQKAAASAVGSTATCK